MTKKQQRIAMMIFILCGVALAVGLSLYGLRQNVTFFMSPSDIAATDERPLSGGKNVRLGGMVKEGSIMRDGMTTRFTVTDFTHEVDVIYRGVPPDLFTENSGVVALGNIDGADIFTATQLLARHDENYMPPEVARMMDKNK